MGTFEDNIRKKFNSAEVPFGADDWGAFEHKLDGAQMSDLIFTQKVVNTLEFSLVPYSPEHWKAMHLKLDLDGNFESKIRAKFSEGAEAVGPAVGWEDMLSKLSVADAGDFETGLKEKLNEEEVDYNEEHWKEIEKILDKDRKPVLWAFLVSGVLLLGAAGIWGIARNESVEASNFNNNVNSTIEHANNGRANVGGDKDQKVNSVVTIVGDGSEIALEPNSGKMSIQNSKHHINVPQTNSNNDGFPTQAERDYVAKYRLEAEKNKNRKTAGSLGSKDDKGRRNMGGGSAGVGSDRTQSESGESSLSYTINNTGSKESTKEEDELLIMDDLGEENVAMSLPDLAYQFTEVQYEKVKTKESVLHVGLLPWLNFWDNAAATGLSGKNQVSSLFTQDWTIYRRYGKQVGFEFNQPLKVLGGYEYKSPTSGFAIGTYISNQWQNNWVCSSVNVSGSYEKKFDKTILRVGAGMSYKRNQLFTEGLTLRDQVSQSTSNYSETALDELKVPAETYISSNVGLLVASKYLMFSYNVGNPLLVRFNYKNEQTVSHTGIMSGTAYLRKDIKVSGMAKFAVAGGTSFTPALSVSKNDSWFLITEFQDLSRCVYTFGYQFSNFRVYSSYGHVIRREVESSITDLFSQTGYVAVGLTYTRD